MTADDTISGEAGRRRWEFSARGGLGRRPRGRPAQASRLAFEPLEPRILLSGNPNPLNSTALTALPPASPAVIQPAATVTQTPTVIALGAAPDVSALNRFVTPAASSAAPISAAGAQPAQNPAPPISGALAVPGQVDTYTFKLTAAKSVYFDSLTNNANISYSLSGPAGQIVNQQALAYADANYDSSPVLQLAAGAYSLTVSGSGATTGAYSFRLLDLSTAAAITPGVQVTDSLSPANSTNAYQFSGTAGERVFLEPQSGSGIYWRLVDPGGQVVANSADGFSPEQVTLGAAGVYTLLVEGYASATSATQPFSFTVYPQADATAALTLGQTTKGAVAQPGQLKAYTFTLAAETHAVFDSLTADNSLNWTLTGPGGTVVSQRGFASSDGIDIGGSDLLDLGAGSYTLTVAGSSDHTAAYAFRLLDLASATATAYGQTVSGTLGDAGASGRANPPATQTLLYKFTGAVGDEIALQSASASGGNVYERLYDPYGNLVDADYLGSFAGATLTVAGTYTIAIEGRVYNTAPATFAFTLAKTGTTTVAPFTGKALTLGAPASGTFATAGETDDYVFSVTGPTRLLFDPLTTPYGAGLSASWQLDGPAGSVVTPQNFYYNQLIDVTAPGTYRLRVISTGAAGQAYSFQVLNLAAATTVAYGATVTDTLSPAGQTKEYAFAATAGDKAFFNALSNNGSVYWRLVDPTGDDVFNSGFGTTGPYTLTKSGKYTLLVGGQYYNGTNPTDFSFAIQKDVDTTTALTLGAVANGSVATAGQNANYTFTLTAATQLYFDALKQYGGLDWTLTGPEGQVVGSTGLDASNNRVISATAGAYTLTINGGGDDTTGAFAFRIIDLAADATSFGYGDTVTGTNAPTQSEGVYKFTASAGDKAFFDTVAQGDGYLNWELLDPSGASVFNQGFSSAGTQALTKAGTYTLLVGGDYYDPNPTSTYSFRVTRETTSVTPVTIDGPAQTGPFSVPGQVGTALGFSGAEGVTASDTAAVDLRNSVSIEFWINPSKYGNPWNAIVYKGDGSNYTSRTYGVFLNSAGFIELDTNDSSGEQYIQTAAGTVPLNQWTHVAAVLDRTAGTMSVYLNGVLSVSGPLRTDAATGGAYPLSIAQSVEGFQSFQGALDDVRLFANAQTAAQIASGYKAPLTGTESGLALYLPMNDATGAASLHDAGPNHAAVAVSTDNAGLPGTITGRIASPGNTNTYTFTLGSAAQLVFDGLTDDSDVTVTLAGPNGLNVTRNLRNGDDFDFGSGDPVIQAAAGQYVITVTDDTDRTDYYAFRFIPLAEAKPINYDTVVSGTLPDGGETQAYSFTGTAGDTLYLNLLSWTKGSFDADFRLIDPFGKQVYGPDYFQDVGRTTLAYNGTYTLLAEGRTFEPAAGSYSFRLDTVHDQSVPLTLGTNPGGAPLWTAGQLGGGLRLTGADQVSVADGASLELTNNVTLQAWIKVDRLPSTWTTIVYKGNGPLSNGDGRTYSLFLNAAGYIYLGTSDASGTESIQTAGGLIVPGAWTHVTGVIDRTDGLMHIYINGVDEADGSVRPQLATASSSPLLLGGTQEADGSFSNFQGAIDDVRAWSVALTAAQVAADYAAPLAGNPAGLALYLKLDETSGAAPADSSANGNKAVVVSQNSHGVTGQIATPGQQVTYSFAVPAAGQYYFDSQTDINAFNWTLTGPQGTVVSARPFDQSDANRGSPLLSLVAGSYTLTVAATGDTTGFYDFRLLPLSSAQALTPGTPVAVTLAPGNSTSLYSFTATAGERVYLDQTSQAGGNVFVRVIDPLGRDLYGAVNYNSLPSFGVQTLALAGTYTVLVDADVYYDPNLSEITLNVQPVVDKAAALTLGAKVSGSIDAAGQATAYSFTLAAATTAYFDALTNNGNLTWTLTGPEGTIVSARPFTQSDSYDQASVALPLAAGAYTLTVRATNDTTGPFAFSLLDAAAATPLAADTATAVSLPAESTQLLSFSGSAGDRVQLISTVVAGDVSWRLIAPGGATLFGPVYFGTEPAAVTLPTTGKYVLAVEGRIFTDTPASGTIKLISLNVPATNGAVSAYVPAVQATPTDLGYFAAGAYNISAEGVASLVSNYSDPNALLFNPDGVPEVPVTRSGFGYLNPSGSPLDVPDGNIYGPGGTSINLGALMGTLAATPTSPSQYFLIGSSKQVTLSSAGHIYAQINDTAYSDNQDGYQVTVTPATAATGAATQGFGGGGLPYALSNESGPSASVGSDATGRFLRLTDGTTSYENNVADFFAVGSAPAASVTADFDARIGLAAAGRGQLIGIGAALSPVSAFGRGGPTQSFGAVPSFAGALGVGLTAGTAADGSQDQVTLTFNGAQVAQVAAGTNLASGSFFHVRISATATSGGSLVSVALTPAGGAATTVISGAFVGGFFTDGDRLSLAGQSQSYPATVDVANVAVATTAGSAPAALTLNTVTSGNIAAAGAVQRYQFTLAKATTAIFDALDTSPGNLSWSLTGPGGAVVGGRYFSQSDTASFSGSPALQLAAGLYTLTVSGQTGPYAFKLDDLAAATPLTLGGPLTGTLDPGDSSKLFSFGATAGERLSVSGVAGWTGYQYYQVIDPNGQQVLGPTPLYANTDTITATVAGTYTLLVEGSYTAASPSSFGLTLNKVTDKTAALTLNTVTSGTIDSAGQRAIYAFTLGAPALLYFDSLTNDGDFTWTLTGPDDVAYGLQNFNQNDFGAISAPAGAYTLTVSNPNNDAHTGPFSFRILNLATAATAYTPGTPVSGTLSQVAGADAYRFTAAAGSKFYFDETAETNNLTWQLVDPFGATVFGPTSFQPQGFVTLTAGGSYTLLIQGYIGNSGTATYTFNLQPPATTTQALTLGAATSGAIATAGETNAYTFTLAKATRVVLAALSDTLDNAEAGGTSLGYTLTGPQGVAASGSLNRAEGTYSSNSSPAVALPAGAYTLTFAPTDDSTGTYTFRLLDLAAAAPLTLGTPVSGTLTPGSDTREYSFTAAAGDRIYAQETSYSGGNLIWRLLDPNNMPLFDTGFGSTPGAFTLTAAGTYTLLLEGFVGNSSQSSASYGFTIFSSPLSAPIPISINGSGGVQAPDLVVTNLAATSGAKIQSGGALAISWTDSNIGAKPTDASWTDRVIVSRADSGQILADVSVPYDATALGALAGGAGAARQVSVKLPDGDAGAGALIVTVTTDAGDTVSEQNASGTAFTNNTSVLDVTSALAPYPDLQVSGVSLSPAAGYQPGDTVTARWTLKNAGSAAAPVAFAEQVSIRNTLTNQVTELLSDTVAAGFAAGASAARSISFAWPSGYSSTGDFEVDVTADSTGVVVEAVPAASRTDNTGTATVLSAPDLAITGASVTNAAPLQSGETVNLAWTDENLGDAATPVAWTDRVRVVNTTTGALLFDQGVASGGTLAVGAQRARSASFALPAGSAGAGALSITITVNQDTSGQSAVLEDSAAANPLANNVAVLAPTSTLAVYPDLVTTTSVPKTGQGGAGLTLSWTVKNSGPGATQAGAWSDEVILSATSKIGAASDVVLGTFAHTGDLATGAAYTQTQTVTLPTGLQGAYYVTVVADARKAVLEPDTRADATSAAALVTIASAYADLATTGVTAPASGSPSGTILVGWKVANNGTGTTNVASWTDDVYLSQSTTVQPGDQLLGSIQHLGALAVGASYAGALQVTLPANLTGTYKILVKADAASVVYQDGLTANDTGASGPIVIGSPDLKVSKITAPAAVQPGQTQTVQWTVTDAGAGDAPGAWSDEVLVSSDGKLSDAVALAYVGRPSGLAAGASYTRSAQVTIPALADGTATFFVVADAYRQVFEANGETDNSAASTPATVTHPDLAVTAVVAPLVAVSGTTAAVSWTVANQGSAAIPGGWTDQVYVASGTTLDGTQQYLGSLRASGPLAAGATYKGSLGVTLPGDLTPGAYHILVLTNANGDVNEAGHSGNNLAASGAVAVSQPALPDLRISGLTVTPASGVVSGDTIAIGWNALNAGGGAVTNSFYSHVVVADTTTGQTLADQQVFYDVSANGPIAAGGSRPQSLSVTLPNGAAGVGTLSITVTADSYDQVYEGPAPKTDNSATVTRTSALAPYADLHVDGLAVAPTALNSGGALSITWTDGNHGTAPVTTAFSDEVQVINQTTGATVADIFVPYDPSMSGSIAAGAGALRQASVTLPAGAAGVGTILVRVIADSRLQVPELVDSGRTDNTATLTLTSALAAYPDLAVSGITAPATADAGGTVTISYTLTNKGTGPATGSWADQISLSSDGTAANDVAVVAVPETNQSVAAGASVTRTVTVALPPTLDGARYVTVTADSLSSLTELNHVSHRGVAASPITIKPALTLSFGQTTVSDLAGSIAFSAIVTRSGGASTTATVTLSASAPGLILPTTVTIPAGQSAAAFQVGALNSGLTGPTVSIAVTASATGYTSGSASVAETDDNTPTLTLAAPATIDRNAGTVAVTLTRNTPTTQPLTVALGSDLTFFIAPPASVTFAAGQSMLNLALPLVDDGTIYGNRNVHLTATAAGLSAAAAQVAVVDTDVPVITLTLGQTMVSEAAGVNATSLTVTRSVVTSQAVSVGITTSIGFIRLPSMITIGANQASASVPLAVLDHDLPTGTSNSIVIAGYVADPNYGTPIAGTTAQTTLTINGSVGPSLSLTLGASTITGTGSTTGTVTRTSPDVSKALTVALQSGNTAEATAPASVTIAPGQTSASFTVTGVNDGSLSSVKMVTVTATAAGYETGAAGLAVSNQNLPDLAVTSLAAPASLVAGTSGKVTYTVTNQGRNAATGPWTDSVYLSPDVVLAGDQTLIGTFTQASLAPGKSYSNSLSFTAPATPGPLYVIVASDSGDVVATINMADKQRASASPVDVTPSYTATVTAATHVAPQGTPILLTGFATNAVTGLPQAASGVTVTITNGSFVRTLGAFTDFNGEFGVTFTPVGKEAGDYTVSAAQPGAAAPPAQDRFTLLGAQASVSSIAVTGTPSGAITGHFTLTNLSGTALTGLTASLSGLPATAQLTVSPIADLAGNGTVTVSYSFNSTAAITGSSTLKIKSAQGVEVDLPFNVSVLPLRPALVADPGYLNAGMVIGTQSQVQFVITNTGGADSGPLTVALPSAPWLSLVTPATIPSISAGGTATVELQLTPAETLALQEYQGSISVTGANVALSVPFTFRATSTATGDVDVAVQDEYTFFEASAPLLAGATVTLTDPYTLQVVATAKTDSTGHAHFTGVDQGGYLLQVTAPNHSTKQDSITVQPGMTNSVTEFVHLQAVSYTWAVVPTTVADHYQIVLQSTFQTAVPIPVVTVDQPLVLPLVLPGQTTTFNLTFTNHGLIAADQLTINVPTNDPNFVITPLVSSIAVLPAGASITVPVSIAFRAGSKLVQAMNEGLATQAMVQSLAEQSLGGAASTTPITTAGYGSAIAGCLGIDAVYTYVCQDNQWVSVPISVNAIGCGEDLYGAAKGALEAAAAGGNLLGAGCSALSAVAGCLGAFGSGPYSSCYQAIVDGLCGGISGAAGGPVGIALGALGSAGSDILSCLCALTSGSGGGAGGDSGGGGGGFGGGGGGYGGSAGDPYLAPVGYSIPTSGCGPTAMSVGSDSAAAATSDAAPASNSVCAQVRLQISQQAVVTRTAFQGTLDISNMMVGTDLTDLHVTLDIRDANGNVANEFFDVQTPTVTGLTATAGGYTLTGGDEGTLQYIFLPTVDAAAKAQTEYFIGGTISYMQDGTLITAPLAAAPIIVYPEAKLNLDYFWQRNVIGDDPFTPQVEPSEPFYLGVRATNVGAGTAADLTITSSQPQIIENQKGLLINFQIVGSQVNGELGTGSLTVDLGTIAPGQTSTADWELLSSLQGRFTDFSATFTHTDDAGSLRTSLINSVNIAPLIQFVHVGDDGATQQPSDDGVASFLVANTTNYTSDGDALPDTLYIGDQSGSQPVTTVAAQFTAGPGGTEILTSAPSTGWSYIDIADPAPNLKLLSIVRSDGEVLTVGDTVWRTDRVFPPTIPGALDINLIHLLDYDSTGSYTLTFINDDGKPPHITAIQNLSGSVLTAAVPSIDVTFSKVIDPTTLTASAVSLTLNGAPVVLSGLTFTDEGIAAGGGETYRIGGLAALTAENGDYTLTVDGTKVSDPAEEAGDNAASTSFVVSSGATVLTSVAPVAPNIRNTPVESVDVTFSAPIDLATFNAGALTLTLNGKAVALDSRVSVVQLTSTTFQIGGLSTLTTANGAYALTVDASRVTDAHGAAAVGKLTDTWTENTVGPLVVAIEPITTNPRNIIVQSLVVTLSEPIDPSSFDYHAVTVTQNGGPNLVTSSTTVTQVDATHYLLAGFNTSFNAATGIDGTYVITVKGATLRDLAGNAGGGSVSESWVLNVTAPPAATNVHISPDNGSSSTDGITNTLSFDVLGSVADPSYSVRLYDLTTNTDLGSATVTGTTFSGAVTLDGVGMHDLRVRVVDAAGNATDTTINVFIDTAPPTVAGLSPVTPNPRTTPVAGVIVQLSKDVVPSSFTAADLSLTRNGAAVPLTSAVTITSLGSDEWQIAGLSAFDAAAGTYVLTVNAAGLSDVAGNAGTGSLDETWTVVGATATGSFGGTVYRDTLGSGSRTTDGTDPGLAGWTVFLDLKGAGQYAAGDPTQVTGTGGGYSFTGLAAGNYTVVVEPMAGFTTTSVSSYAVILGAGQTATTTYDFGEFQLGSLSGVVFDDANASGAQDPGEAPLAGVTVFIDRTGDGVLRASDPSVVTDADGAFSFTGIGPGTIRLGEVPPAGEARTTPAVPITVASGYASTTAAIGDAKLGSISGTLYDDLNGDGTREANEPGLAGWTVVIDTNRDGQLEAGEPTQVTGANGSYTFSGLLPGSYTIAEVLQPGYVETSPSSVAPNSTAISSSGSSVAIHVDGTWTGPGGQDLGALANQDAANLTQLTQARQQAAFAGLEGQGETTVVIDTGIDDSSTFFGSASRIVYEYDFADGVASAVDTNGHGSNVASIIGSSSSTYPGVAPDTNLIILKVFDAAGQGTFGYVAQALDWVAANVAKYHIGVVNMSLGDEGDWTDLLSRYGLGPVLAELQAEDVITVAAAGNDYAQTNGLGLAYPASDPSVVAVGSVWAGDLGGPYSYVGGGTDYTTAPDQIAAYSQRSTSLNYTLAPGSALTGANATGGASTYQGTSQAAAYVSGAATLVQELADKVLGRHLSTAEFASLLQSSGDLVTDASQGDNVTNTGLTFTRLDFTKLFDAVEALGSVPPPAGGGAGGPTTGPVVPATAAAPGETTVSLAEGKAVAGVDFGDFKQGAVSGSVYDDANRDGVRQGSEVGVAGVTVFIDAAGTGKLAASDPQTTTNADGNYSFSGIGPGSYVVRIVPPAGDVGTTPDPVTIASVSGAAETAVFGVAPPVSGAGTYSASGPATATIGQPYTIILSASDPRPITEWFVDWGDGTLQGFAGDPTSATHTYARGGVSYTVSPSAMDSAGLHDAAPFSVAVGAPLEVVSVTPNPSGVLVRFNHAIDPLSIHLYETAADPLGPPDVTLVGAVTGPVTGSLVFDADLMGVTFIATGGPLAADTYTLTLVSGETSFHDTIGALDGADDGVPGSANATETFTEAANPGATLSVPDFARAPGQSVDYAVGGHGIPVTLSNAVGVTSVTFHVDYDPTLLTISGVVAGSVPAGAALVANVSTPGHAVFTFTSSAPLSGGAVSLGAIAATVPASAVYGTRQVLKFGVDGAKGGTVVADDALQVVALLGDTDGSGQYDAQDATLVQQVVVKTDSGFAAWPDVDPVILADVARHGALLTIDATRIAQEALTHARPEFPPPPATPYTVDPQVLATGLPPAAMQSAMLAAANALLLDADGASSDVDPARPHPKSEMMRVKLARRFHDFTLTGAAADAAWKRSFVTDLVAAGASQAASIRVTL